MSARKRQRTGENLHRLLHSGGISVSGLADLLKTIGDNPVSVRSTWHLRQANLDTYNSIRRVATLPLKSGGNWEWEYLDPNKLLCVALGASTQLTDLFASAMARTPPTLAKPWELVIGFDAFVPGYLCYAF